MRTATYSWDLVPEHADPAWPLFDRLIATIDTTLADVQNRTTGLEQGTLVYSSNGTGVAAAVKAPATFVAISAAPRGAVTATITVQSGRALWCDVQMSTGFFRDPGTLRVIANPGSLNITGDSWMPLSNMYTALQSAVSVRCASIGPGEYTLTLEGRQTLATNSGDTLFQIGTHAPVVMIASQLYGG